MVSSREKRIAERLLAASSPLTRVYTTDECR